ncbi:MAG: cell wall anchor protein [Muribaculaceae bacterium]|nr:cell wall anchor protein [Muribaculaceae bacterium]
MGKQTTLHIEIIEDISSNGILPINDERIDTIIRPIEIISRGVLDTIDLHNNRRQINQDIIIQSFDSGLYVIPPILYIANNDSFKSNELALKVIPVPVDSMATINEQANVLEPNSRWFDFLPDFITDNWGWILLSILIITGAIIYYITRKKEVLIPLIPRKKPIPPHELAMQQLSELKEAKLCEKGQEKEFYTRLTDILRVYIDTRFGINAMEMTSSQIIEALNSNEISKEPNKYMKQILETADFVKFAKVRPLPEDNTKSFNWATQFVVDTKPIEQQDPEKETPQKTVELNKQK